MYMVYIYIGKISLNFIISKEVQEFLVVDVGNFSTQGYWERYRPHNWKQQERKIMSFVNSPYHTWQAVTWEKVIFMGKRLEESNNFNWNTVVIDLLLYRGYAFQKKLFHK